MKKLLLPLFLLSASVIYGQTVQTAYCGASPGVSPSDTSNSWRILGNSGTTAGTNFVGTKDNIDLVFKRNNVVSGLINSASNNTAFGNASFNLTSTASANTAIGNGVLNASTNGGFNTGVGTSVMNINTTGVGNTGIGVNVLALNISGGTNTGIGLNALNKVTGTANVGVGAYAGNYLTSGSNQFFVNNQDRANYAGDTTKSLLYGKFTSAGTTNQWLRVNGTLRVVSGGNDSSKAALYVTSSNLTNLLGLSNNGSMGINCLTGQAGVVDGYVSDCALEVCSRTNEANNSFIFAAKSYSATQTYFRIRSNSQPGYIGEFYQGWKHFGNMGFNINPDSSRQVQIKGWNASASWYPFIVTNGSNTNLFNLEADGHTNLFGYLTTNRLATNASIATVTGGLAINTVKSTIATSGDGSAALRICGVDALAAGNGGFLSFEAVYDASNKYAMGTIGGIKENATSGNSAGALVFQTHTSGIGSMYEAARFNSTQDFGVGTGATILAKAHIKSAVSDASADIFLAEAADGTDRFKVRADGFIFAGNTTAENIFIGVSGNTALTSGTLNTCVGQNAGRNINSGFANYVYGDEAGTGITTGSHNVSIGYQSMVAAVTGNNNTGIGRLTLTSLTSGLHNIAMGLNAGLLITSGEENVAIGRDALSANVGGGYNTAIGTQAGKSTVGSSNLFLGQYAGAYETGSNSIYIDVLNRTSTALDKTSAPFYAVAHATVTTQSVAINAGQVGINGRLKETQGADVASSSTITLTFDGNAFELTGTTAVNFITTTGWSDGSELVLIANESVTINDDAGGGNLRLAGNANFAMTADDVLTLIYSSTTAGGAIWREKSRSVN